MDDDHTVLEHGNVLVRNDRIVAIWQGEAPEGTLVGDAVVVELPRAFIFPGLMNLHDHPTYDTVRLAPTPSSHAQPSFGRPLGTEPYGNRYQWNGMEGNSPPEFKRLIQTPQAVLFTPAALNLGDEALRYAEVKALVGGETTVENNGHAVLARNVESPNFGRQRVDSRVQPIDTMSGAELADLLSRMHGGQVDAWLPHLAEGVRDGDRPPGDLRSSRSEFTSLKAKGLLTDVTVVVHGAALEAEDFAQMRSAPSIRNDATGDGLGAKLVWSPLSNLLLYGHTANVYDALAADVVVSLGTDWTPSGSRNLLGELKVADIALRDPALLGGRRDLVPELSVAGKRGTLKQDAERALDRLLVDMVTRNPARSVRWYDQVGSIEPGKVADLLVITDPPREPRQGLPRSPYRSLIDATERDVQLLLVGGDPLVGDADLMTQLKPGNHEAIPSACGCYQKAVAMMKAGAPKGDQTLAAIEQMLNDGLLALGGDNPPPGGGPADLSNKYSYLKQHFTLPFPMTDAQFMWFVLIPNAGLVNGKLNLEALTLAPLLENDDDFFFDVLGARFDAATHVIADPTPPFLLYPSNANQLVAGVNPFASDVFEDRWYKVPRLGTADDGQQDDGSQGPICFVDLVAPVCQRR